MRKCERCERKMRKGERRRACGNCKRAVCSICRKTGGNNSKNNDWVQCSTCLDADLDPVKNAGAILRLRGYSNGEVRPVGAKRRAKRVVTRRKIAATKQVAAEDRVLHEEVRSIVQGPSTTRVAFNAAGAPRAVVDLTATFDALLEGWPNGACSLLHELVGAERCTRCGWTADMHEYLRASA